VSPCAVGNRVPPRSPSLSQTDGRGVYCKLWNPPSTANLVRNVAAPLRSRGHA
jgi:hypothetical protein